MTKTLHSKYIPRSKAGVLRSHIGLVYIYSQVEYTVSKLTSTDALDSVYSQF